MPPTHILYGRVPDELASDGIVVVPAGAVQCSPLAPPSIGSGANNTAALSEYADAALASATIHAPASTLERRRVLALALRALAPGGTLVAFAGNDKGGTRIASEIEAFGVTTQALSKRHYRIVRAVSPEAPTQATRKGKSSNAAIAPTLDHAAIDAAIAEGDARVLPGLVTAAGLWTMPGLFNWDTVDPGTQLLLDHLPPRLSGRGIDLGCGIGIIAKAVLAGGGCNHMTLADIDRRALDLACRNVAEDAAGATAGIAAVWTDIRTTRELPTGLDFVVMNPPFHAGGSEDRGLGQAFIARAAQILKPGGQLWMTANRHLPYEAALTEHFESVETIAQANGFKIASARKPMKPRKPQHTAARTDVPGERRAPTAGAFGRKAAKAPVEARPSAADRKPTGKARLAKGTAEGRPGKPATPRTKSPPKPRP